MISIYIDADCPALLFWATKIGMVFVRSVSGRLFHYLEPLRPLVVVIFTHGK